MADPPHSVGDCPEWEDNFVLVLDLVVDVGAPMLVPGDVDLTQCRPGVDVSLARRADRDACPFAGRVAGVRRHRAR